MVSINKLQNEFSYSFNEIGIILNLSSFVYINNIYGTNNKTLVLNTFIAWNRFFSTPLIKINCLAKNHVP